MKVDKLVPEIYYKGSRDFSFLGRIFEVLLNYMRIGSDIVGSNLDYDELDSNILELLCNTLGFIVRHRYTTKDLVALSNVFSILLKNKGNIKAITLAVETLLNSQNVNKLFSVKKSEDPNDNDIIQIYLPQELNDIILLEDVFEYILPAGMLYEFTFVYKQPDIMTEAETESIGNQTVQFTNDEALGNVYNDLSNIKEGLKGYNEGVAEPKALTYLGNIVVGDEIASSNQNQGQ